MQDDNGTTTEVDVHDAQDDLKEVVRRPAAPILEDEGSEEAAMLSESAADEAARSGIVSARGTAEGLVLRVDGRVELEGLRTAVANFIRTRRSFLEGQEISIEWVGRKPSDDVAAEMQTLLKNDFDIVVRSSRLREYELRARDVVEPVESASVKKGIVSAVEKVRSIEERRGTSLFDGIEALSAGDESRGSAASQRPRTRFEGDPTIWDEPDSRVIYGTLRSGQKIETEHSLIICGDVNSGAEVVAGGDIIVLGTLRGVAHAGAYDETGGGRFIFSLNLQPTQLRIGTVISRGAPGRSEGPEIARVDGTLIVVEGYQSRAFSARKL
ncbi:MAG: septum site-determining protein MinC [Bdellovibrionota bacterium]|nr:MAG: septum site-determining protein MinC [Bdellovibrionota bacterium]